MTYNVTYLQPDVISPPPTPFQKEKDSSDVFSDSSSLGDGRSKSSGSVKSGWI